MHAHVHSLLPLSKLYFKWKLRGCGSELVERAQAEVRSPMAYNSGILDLEQHLSNYGDSGNFTDDDPGSWSEAELTDLEIIEQNLAKEYAKREYVKCWRQKSRDAYLSLMD